MTDITKMKELAERATPGPWVPAESAESDHEKWVMTSDKQWSICAAHSGIDGADCAQGNAEFIAAANPQAILGLIAEVERLRRDLPRLVSYAEDLSTCTLTMDDGVGYFYHRVTDKELAEIDQLTQEVAWLRKRLEISDKHPYDGISCRDETIKGLDEKCERLEAENEMLRKQLEQVHPFKFAGPIEGPDLKCAACGGYHYGLPPNMPCPKSAAVAYDAALEGGGR